MSVLRAVFLSCIVTCFVAGTAHADEGEKLIARFQCGRCHELPSSISPVPRRWSCLACHQAVLRGELERAASAETVAEWKSHIKSLVRTPSLANLPSRLSKQWVASFIAEPFHVRPRSGAWMPRLRITCDEARAIATRLYAADSADTKVTPALGSAASGLTSMEKRGCFACHQFSGVPDALAPLQASPPGETARSAPDLRYTRDRMTPALVKAWLSNPAAIAPDTLMPNPGLASPEIDAIVAAIMSLPLTARPVLDVPKLEPLKRSVSFDEVQSKVLNVVCRHCHASPDVVGPEAGPGSTGGFGFHGVDLDLTSEAGVKRGLKRWGTEHRESILAIRASGYPRLIEVLLARHREEELGTAETELFGMPLGFAPIPYEDIRLVLTWTLQESRNEVTPPVAQREPLPKG